MPIHFNKTSISSKLSYIKLLDKIFQILFDIIFKSIRFYNKLFYNNGNSICIISIHKIGDSIFTFDAVNSIKSFYKKDIYILCHYNAKDIYALIHPEEMIIPIAKKYFHFGDRYLNHKARKILNSLNPEIIIDLTGVMTSASLIFNSKAKKIFGMNRKIFRSIYDQYYQLNTNFKGNEIYLNVIKNWMPIVPLIKETNNIKEVKKILIAPFAGWPAKQWGLNKFLLLAEKLNDKYEVTIIFDNTYISNEHLNYLITKKINFFKSNSIKELIDKIKQSDLVIGNDSGPVHIAAHLGKYTFTIYGPTNPLFHLPEGGKNYYIQKIIECSPKENQRLCFTDGGRNGCKSFECLNTLSIEEVYKSIISKFN